MARKCAVCYHPEIARINGAILNTSIGDRRISELFGLTERQIQNHREKHITELLAEHKAQEIAVSIDESWTDFSLHRHVLNDAIMNAYQESNYRAIASLIGQATRRHELVAKLYGMVSESVTVGLDSQIVEMLETVIEQLGLNHPEAAQELNRLIGQAARGDMAISSPERAGMSKGNAVNLLCSFIIPNATMEQYDHYGRLLGLSVEELDKRRHLVGHNPRVNDE